MRLGAGCIVIAAGMALASGHALAQTAPAALAPSVIVAPVVSQDVTDTSDFVGRVTAINKVDIVARVPGLHRATHCLPKANSSRRATSCSASSRTPTRPGRATASQSRQGESDRGQRRRQLARGKALLAQGVRAEGDSRSANRRAAERRGRHLAGAGGARSGEHQSRLHGNPFADRRPHRHRQLYGRQSGRPEHRKPGDHRQLRSDLCPVPGERARRARLQAPPLGKQDPRRDSVTVRVRLADGKLYPEPGDANFLDIQADSKHRYGRGAGADFPTNRRCSCLVASSACTIETRRAALGAVDSTIGGPTRSGRQLSSWSSIPRTRSSCAASSSAPARSGGDRRRRLESGRAGHRRRHPRKSVPVRSWQPASRRETNRMLSSRFSSTGRVWRW